MADGGDGFGGCIEVVQRTRGYRRWTAEVKARIVAESFQPGVRVVDVARRHGLAAHQLSDWRGHAREGVLVLPADAMAEMPEDNLPAFVPVLVKPESPGPSAEADRTGGVITIEFGHDLVLRVPGDVPAARAAAVVHALRSPGTGAESADRAEARSAFRRDGGVPLEAGGQAEDSGVG